MEHEINVYKDNYLQLKEYYSAIKSKKNMQKNH